METFAIVEKSSVARPATALRPGSPAQGLHFARLASRPVAVAVTHPRVARNVSTGPSVRVDNKPAARPATVLRPASPALDPRFARLASRPVAVAVIHPR